MTDLESLKFEDLISIEEAMSILGDEGIFFNCLKVYSDELMDNVKELHACW